MKFYLYKTSDPLNKKMEEIEINSIEDLKKLQEYMQENYRQKENIRPDFSRCDLIINFAVRRGETRPTIQIYDDFIE